MDQDSPDLSIICTNSLQVRTSKNSTKNTFPKLWRNVDGCSPADNGHKVYFERSLACQFHLSSNPGAYAFTVFPFLRSSLFIYFFPSPLLRGGGGIEKGQMSCAGHPANFWTGRKFLLRWAGTSDLMSSGQQIV
ncbi:hypothetical protein CEXT_718611 [Caerostris extrusa]|uniref:Uncharacterized protein n=1 Tax=Caerostris extrusa TaxID=172846 RepID=A0AAV4USQ5_CAEEX|nr:hypothetical protein CEXT_718611 [Caerostris extrusa]